LPPGFLPFTMLVNPTTDLDHLTANSVRWTHAKLHLMHAYPNLAESLLEEAYRRALETRWDASDPRIRAVFNPNLDFLWGEQVWLDARHFRPTNVDNDAANGLPYCQYIVLDSQGHLTTSVDQVRRSQVKNRTPNGYRPVRPVIGMSFSQDDDTIPVVAPPKPRFPIKLLDNPLPEDDAFQLIEEAFPLLNRDYLKACLAARIAGEARRGQPPMLACTGPSGSGKEQHIRLAASFVGDDIVKLSIDLGEQELFREIGMAITSGHRFIVFDELGKTEKLITKIKPILEISTAITWRPLYQNRIVLTPVIAAFFFPCVWFPDFLTASAEFNRRTRCRHLYRRLGDWERTSGGDTILWRDHCERHALAANSILTHVWRLCGNFDYCFDSSGPSCIAAALGLGRLADGAPGVDPEVLRDLYRHCRGEDTHRDFLHDASFMRGWVNLDAPRAREIVSAFVPLDDASTVKQARGAAQTNLQAQAWNDLLAIDSPPIRCQVKIHGNRWGIRFVSADPVLRGRELLNEQLPPIPGASVASITSSDTPGSDPSPSTTPDGLATQSEATDVLRSAGMPS
jgi:hypothetical protein